MDNRSRGRRITVPLFLKASCLLCIFIEGEGERVENGRGCGMLGRLSGEMIPRL